MRVREIGGEMYFFTTFLKNQFFDMGVCMKRKNPLAKNSKRVFHLFDFGIFYFLFCF